MPEQIKTEIGTLVGIQQLLKTDIEVLNYMKNDLIRVLIIMIGMGLSLGFSILIAFNLQPMMGQIFISGLFLFVLGLVVGRFLERGQD